jgi:hypothetical protein
MDTIKHKLNTSFFFLCLGLLISLITSVVSFLNLVFSTLDKKYPDVLNSTYQYGYSTYDFESIRISLATLVIFFPVFIVVSYFWRKFSKGEMGHIDEIIKKWTTYIILFLSSIVIVVDLVTLVRYFISGEITNRFIYKIVSTLFVAIIIGFYYILIIRGKKELHNKLGLIFGFIGLSLVVFSVVISFSIIGSPKTQRMLRLDERRISDLQNMQYQVINYWQQKEKLPVDLKTLSNPLTGYSLPVPPEFEKGEVYGYKTSGPLKFELCATFSLPMQKGWRDTSGSYSGIMPVEKSMSDTVSFPIGGTNESWNHEAGKACFERIIDKDIYPPFSKMNVR